MGTKKINKCVLYYKTYTQFPLHQILSNSIENNQIWTKITNFGHKITKFNQNSSNSTKNHLIYRIENYIEKMTVNKQWGNK